MLFFVASLQTPQTAFSLCVYVCMYVCVCVCVVSHNRRHHWKTGNRCPFDDDDDDD